jgi:hypothetical protein
LSDTNHRQARLAPQDEMQLLNLIHLALTASRDYFIAEDCRYAAMHMSAEIKNHPISECVDNAARAAQTLIRKLEPFLPKTGETGEIATDVAGIEIVTS